MAPTFRLTGNQQTRLSLTTYFWSLKDPWLGASSSAYKQPGALHTPHAYTLARCFGLQSRLLSSFPLSSIYFFFLCLCLSPLCATARLVVLKRVCFKPFKVKNKEEQTPLICLPWLFLDPIPTPCSHPGIGLHVTMVAGGHLDARRCGRVGSWLAGSRQPEEQRLVGKRRACWRAVWNAGSTARIVVLKLTGSSKHVSFCFYVFCRFTFSALFHIICNFGMFCPQKKNLFFLCNISSLCAISYVPMVAIYVYQLNIWLIFKSMWLNSMFISHEDVGCLYLHLKLHLWGRTRSALQPAGCKSSPQLT